MFAALLALFLLGLLAGLTALRWRRPSTPQAELLVELLSGLVDSDTPTGPPGPDRPAPAQSPSARAPSDRPAPDRPAPDRPDNNRPDNDRPDNNRPDKDRPA